MLAEDVPDATGALDELCAGAGRAADVELCDDLCVVPDELEFCGLFGCEEEVSPLACKPLATLLRKDRAIGMCCAIEAITCLK